MTSDPFDDPFYIPPYQAVMIFHEGCFYDYSESVAGKVALIAPTFTPGLSHFGIAAVIGEERKFITGPAIVRTNRIWRQLLQLDGYCPSSIVLLEKDHDWSIPTANPDDFIDLVVSRKEPA